MVYVIIPLDKLIEDLVVHFLKFLSHFYDDASDALDFLTGIT